MTGTGLNLSQQQRQVMTLAPQLRQSLEMLQMPVMELRAAVFREMSRNPTVEMTDPAEVPLPDAAPGAASAEEHPTDAGLDFNPDVDAILRQDDEWRDYFMQGMEGAPSDDAEEKRKYLFDSIRQPVSLQDHLIGQLGLTDLKGADRDLALTLIGNINGDGYFTGSLPDIVMVSGRSEREVLGILRVVQGFDPPGVGARTLRECLLRQLDAAADSPSKGAARLLVDRHLERLAARDEKFLRKALGLDAAGLERAAALVRSLNPRPGLAFGQKPAQYVQPEVFVVKEKGRFVARVDSGNVPHIRISARYRQMLEDPGISADTKSYIRDRIRAGAFLIRSIGQRRETIRKIAQTIVDAQTGFLTGGVGFLKPMTMAEVAGKAGVHETTVSRTVANKYMHTPMGVFEMKYFFTPGLKGGRGAAVSNKSVQEMIRRMVGAEDPRAPLSDLEIVRKLAENGCTVARRTVNKYRGFLKIPPARLRRRV